MNKKIISMLIALSISIGASGCSAKNTTAASSAQVVSSITVSAGSSETVGEAGTTIELGDTVTVNGSGVTVDKQKVTITAGGTYSIKGTLSEGQIIINAGEKDKVYLILNGVNINCSSGSPIYVMSCDKAVISMAEGTNNYIKDTSAEADTDQDAAIFSKADLVFTGAGLLKVESENNCGIAGKDDLKIQNGNISVTAAKDGIKGKDSVAITDGNITVNAKEDGIKSTNDSDTEKGYVLITGGKINIIALNDGIEGEVNTFIKDGDITINTGGGSANAASKDEKQGSKESTTEEDSSSVKAIKAGVNIVIEGGSFNIDSSDDGLHSNNNLVINNGAFNISTGDDGLHSDSILTINKGNVDITKSYEGIESKTITINGGSINVVSSDDGINASAGSSTQGQNGNASDGSIINLNGGNLTVNASGDGIDSNGSIKMTAGTAIVNGPTDNGNGALDYNGTFDLTGGVLVAAGSSGMAQAPSTSSTENSVKVNLVQQAANTIVHIVGEDGTEIITFAPSKQYSSIVVSSPELKTGSTYKVYVGGSSSGTAVNGIYSKGTYSNGTEVGSFTVSSTVSEVTQAGAASSNNMGGHGGGRPAPGQSQNQ